MKHKKRIFIGCSDEYLTRDDDGNVDNKATKDGKLKPIFEGLSDAKCKAVPWWTAGELSYEGISLLEKLINASKIYEGGIFVLGKDKETKLNGKKGISNVNVLLEAGMWFSSKSTKQTFIVLDGKYNEILTSSDMGDFRPPSLLDNRLRERVCKFFQTEYDAEQARFDKNSFFINKILLDRLKNKEYVRWITKGQYIGNNSARLWNKIEGSQYYKINVQELVKFQKEIIDNHKVDFQEVDNIVSLGCGNGLTDNKFIKGLKKINPSICYIPVDINPMLAHIAGENIDPTIRIPFAVIDDFEVNKDHIKNILDGKDFEIGKNNFFMMLGNTFSNLEGAEVDFFNKLKYWMDENDYCLIDVSLNTEDDLKSLQESNHNEHYHKLFANSLWKREIIVAKNLEKGVKITAQEESDKVKSEYTDLPETKVYSYKFNNEKLLISKRYNYEIIKEEIKANFNLIFSKPVKSESGRKKAFFLIKK